MDGCSYRLNLWPDEVSFSIAHVTECPAYFHTYIRYVRIFFINANCSKTKAGSVIQRTCCLQQSTFTILWSLKGIKSNYRSGFWVVRNRSILFCERTLVSTQRILETFNSFISSPKKLLRIATSESWKLQFSLYRSLEKNCFRTMFLFGWFEGY